MKEQKRLYRSNDNRLIGGVCAGIADYFNCDPLVVRILAVVLVIVTSGLLGIAYVALWLILPLSSNTAGVPVDVQPEQVHSENYGKVTSPCCEKKSEASVVPDASYSVPVAGHVPPEPPKAYGSAGGSNGVVSAGSDEVGADTSTKEPGRVAGSTMPFYSGYPSQSTFGSVYATPASGFAGQGMGDTGKGASTPPPSVPPVQPPPAVPPYGSDDSGLSRSGAKVALWFGILLLFAGTGALVGNFVIGVHWWQFWPLVFVIAGICYMVIPGKKGRRVDHFVDGLVMFSAGVFLLAMSLDLIKYSSLGPIFSHLWPVLLIMAGFFVLANALKMSIFTLCAGLCFTGFCVAGLLWFGIPGATEAIYIYLPFADPVMITINPWISDFLATS